MFFTRLSPIYKGLLFLLLFSGIWSCKGRARLQPHGDWALETGASASQTEILPDGSTIVVSPKTKVRISKEFNKSERNVEIDGELLFTVDKETGKPFIVHTRNLVIEVLGAGSRFKVEAFASNAGEEVDLLSGKLRVKKTYHSDTDNEPETIESGEMVMINRDIDLMEKEKMNAEELKALKDKF